MAIGVPITGYFPALGPLTWASYVRRQSRADVKAAQSLYSAVATVTSVLPPAADATIHDFTIDYPDTDDWRSIYQGDISGAVGGLARGVRFYGIYFRLDAPYAPAVTRAGKVYTFVLRVGSNFGTVGECTVNAEFGGVVVTTTTVGNVATFTRDLSTPCTEIRFEAIDEYGQRSAWLYCKLGPVCSFVIDDSANPSLALDGRVSFDPDGHITNWEWLINSVVETTGETSTYDASSHEGFNIFVNLQVTDNDGLTALCEQVRVPIESNVFHSSLVDAAGHTLVARNDGQNVIVEAFPSGAASRQVRSTLTNSKNPSIWRDKSNNLYLLRTDRGSNNAVKTKSRDSGRSWI